MTQPLLVALVAAALAGVLLVPPVRPGPRRPRPRGTGLPGRVRAVLTGRRSVAAPELGLVCTAVAARVRAGQAPGAAWVGVLAERGASVRGARALRRGGADATRSSSDADPDGLPGELLALAGRSPGADGAIVATRVAVRSGAPLADVLDAVAVAVAEAEAAHADRRRAQAGPATTARLLGWLPLAALALGVGLGADPVALAREGGVGLASMVAGVVLMVAGRWWSRALVRAAVVDEDVPDGRG